MAQVRMILVSVAAATLTLGIGGKDQTPVDHQKSLSTSDIVFATNDGATNPTQNSQGNEATDENTKGSAKMGEEDGSQSGANQNPPKNDSQKIDQAARKNPTIND